jgi:hypothetical protein
MRYHIRFYKLIAFVLLSAGSTAQKPPADTLKYKTVSAETFYQNKSNFYQRLWGHNRRVEWATPVQVPLLWLDTAYGGLKPYAVGGGNETKSLRLKTSAGKEYTLRSINKSRDDVVSTDFKNTFVEDIIKDQVSSSHPYAAFALAEMQQQAGIYHTTPTLVYLPQQAALDTFNQKFGNALYLFEQRPDGDWNEAANFGHFKDFSSTEDVIKELQEDYRHKADQHAFVKARLFDMLISDWDRHEDNWRWGKADSTSEIRYFPVPRDRDQAFYTHDGILLNFLLPAAGLSYMQNFGYKVSSINTLNVEEKDMDRFFSNELDLDDWVKAATSLQQSLTDTVIAQSVQQLPPEIFAICGNELIEKLKSRRKQLVDFATAYYLFMAKEVEVIGSREREYFEVLRSDTGQITVSVFRINKEGGKEDKAHYRRIFKPSETKEIRLYGIAGEDVYIITGNSTPIAIRIIGGPDKDSVVQAGTPIYIYDDRGNISQTGSAKWRLSSDSGIHTYKYKSYHYDSKGFSPNPFYNHEDKIFIGLNYGIKKYKWRRDPFASQHNIGINYSLSQHSISTLYDALYPKVFYHWDVLLNINYDAVRWTNFYGLGNETHSATKKISYYRMLSHEWLAIAGLRRRFDKSTVELVACYQYAKIKSDTNNYAGKIFRPSHPDLFIPTNFGGFRFIYTYISLNDSVVPTKGFSSLVKGAYLNNFKQHEFFQNYSVKLQAYFRLSNKFSLAIKAGGSAVIGNSAVLNTAQVYEHAVIGGPETLRGYRMERFWGKTSFYNMNELRFITNLRTHALNAKAGFIAFFDDGRVWMPGESSHILHTSYGGGILLAPFHLVCFTLTYGISNEAKLFQLKMNSLF